MNKQYLDLLAEAYTIDFDMIGEIEPYQISNILMNSLQELREKDEATYFELFQMPKMDQQEVLKNYLHLEFMDEVETNDEVIEEGPLLIGMGTLILIGLGSSYVGRKKISKGVFKAFKNAGEVFNSAAKVLSKKGTEWKYKYIIIFQNEKKCYLHAKVNPDDVHWMSPFGVTTRKNKMRNKIPEISVKQATELRDCFLNSKIEQIKLFTESYFMCLKKTGGWDKIKDVHENKIITTLKTHSLAPGCVDYFNQTKELLSVFENVLDFLYESNNKDKAEWVRLLSLGIVKVKKNASFEKKPFSKPYKPAFKQPYKKR